MRLLLLNPPGTRPYLRDYYCASIAKTAYSYPTVDLIYLTGRLAPLGEVRVTDAIAQGLSQEKVSAAIEEWRPNVVISLISALSLQEDMALLRSIKRPDRLLMVTGDIIRDLGVALLGIFPFLDAAFADFTDPAIVDYLHGCRDTPLPNMAFHASGGRILPGPTPGTSVEFSLPLPHWDLAPLDAYRFPFVRHRPFASVLTDFGCPFACSFCPMGTIPWKVRPIPEVRTELENLVSMGVREIHFRDQTFGLPRTRLDALCATTAELELTWSCFSRVDVLALDTIQQMHEAGCHTIIFGIESAGEERRKSFQKNTSDDDTARALGACRRCGVRTVGTFVLGLPGDDETRLAATVRYARSLPLDYASFNVAMPRFGTELRRRGLAPPADAEALRALLEDRWGFAPLETATTWCHRANRRFYLHPRTWVRHLAVLRSWRDLRDELRMGWDLLVR